MTTPQYQIRAVYDEKIIRVYQAYRDEIADAALAHGTFVSPPFKISRMTWIKPSFLWMMYRCGWGYKDEGQRRILAIDISREGFEWALANSCPSHPRDSMSMEEYDRVKGAAPVRIQWIQSAISTFSHCLIVPFRLVLAARLFSFMSLNGFR